MNCKRYQRNLIVIESILAALWLGLAAFVLICGVDIPAYLVGANCLSSFTITMLLIHNTIQTKGGTR